MEIKTTTGRLSVEEINWSSRCKAKEASPTGNWEEGEEIALVRLSGYDWVWLSLQDISY